MAKAKVGSWLAVRATPVVELPTVNGNSFSVERGMYSAEAFADVTLISEH